MGGYHGAYIRDYSALGSILESPYFEKLPYQSFAKMVPILIYC